MEFKKSTTYIVIILLNCHFVRGTGNTATHQTRMFNSGDVAPLGHFKFVALIHVTRCETLYETEDCSLSDWFTATILSKNHLLTSPSNLPCVVIYGLLYGDDASDEFTYRNMKFDIRVGRASQDSFKNPTQRIVARYPEDMEIFFEDSDMNSPEDPDELFCLAATNVAVLYIHTNIDFNKDVKPIPILRMPISSETDKNCIAVTYNVNNNVELQYARVTVGDTEYCKNISNDQFTFEPYDVCSKSKDLRDICEGHSGSPLVCKSESSFYYLVGIVSAPYDTTGDLQCGKTNTHYVVYTYPGYFEKWLRWTRAKFVDLEDVGRGKRSWKTQLPNVARSGGISNSTGTSGAAEMQTHPHSAAILIVFIVCCYLS